MLWVCPTHSEDSPCGQTQRLGPSGVLGSGPVPAVPQERIWGTLIAR